MGLLWEPMASLRLAKASGLARYSRTCVIMVVFFLRTYLPLVNELFTSLVRCPVTYVYTYFTVLSVVYS